MQVILLDKVVNLGNLGDIVKVKDGYARNFLIPSGRARRATQTAIDEFQQRRSELEKQAAEKLREKLATVSLGVPRFPVINNIDVAVEDSAERIRDALYRQAFGPVRWVQCVQAMKARGIRTVVECGPGKVLAGMTKRIDPELTGLAVYDPATLAEARGALL